MKRCRRALFIFAAVTALSPWGALAGDKPLTLPPAHLVKPHLPPASPSSSSSAPASPSAPASSVADTLDARGLGEARVQTPPFIFNKDGTPYRPGQDVDPLGKAPDFWRQLFVWRGALKPPARPLILPMMPTGRLRPTLMPPTAPVAPAPASK